MEALCSFGRMLVVNMLNWKLIIDYFKYLIKLFSAELHNIKITVENKLIL